MQKKIFDLDERIKKLIEDSEYIFFDIFDTPVTRPFVNPKGLFSYIEYTYNIPDFCKARVNAERAARTKTEEVNISDIYDHIHPIYKPLKSTEEQLEIELSYAIEKTKEIYEYSIFKKKKIFFVSDMYLDQNTICKILAKNKYYVDNNLYLSNELRLTKRTGNLYDFILKNLNILTPSKVLMIGDNLESDVRMPLKKGIKSYHITRHTNQDKHFSELYETLHYQCTSSALLKIISEFKEKDTSYWYKIGYKLAGPIAYAFTRYIIDIIEKHYKNSQAVNVLFIGRDGYLLDKCFSLLSSNIEHHYLYAPRTFLSQLNLKENTTANFDTLFQKGSIHLNKYRTYLNKYISSSQELLIIDTRTASFSAQKLIQFATTKVVTGIYWEVATEEEQNLLFPYFEFKDAYPRVASWRLFEFLITSPEPPIRGLDSALEPIFLDSKIEQERSEKFVQIELGCLSFIQDLISHFPSRQPPVVSYKSIVDYVNSFLKNPTQKDIKEFQNVTISVDEEHIKYMPFLSTGYSNNDIKSYLKNLSQCLWKTPYQTLIINITHPIQVRINKPNKTIVISILPKLSQTLFGSFVNLAIFNIKFIIGKQI